MAVQIGSSAFVTPWVWRGVLALDRGGLATAIILSVNAFGASLPSFGHSLALLATSALVFGVAFFAVVGSTTDAQTYWGAALDAGGQAVMPGGFTVGGGVGVGFLHMASATAVFPRFLLQMGWSF